MRLYRKKTVSTYQPLWRTVSKRMLSASSIFEIVTFEKGNSRRLKYTKNQMMGILLENQFVFEINGQNKDRREYLVVSGGYRY